MRAATTKIPHFLYEKDLLKTPYGMNDFIYNWWFIYNEYYMMGIGETSASTLAEFPVLVRIFTAPTPQHVRVSPLIVVTLTPFSFQVRQRPANTMVREQPESRSAEHNVSLT